MAEMNWQVYIILCSDNSLYTGVTTNIERRFLQHKNGKGAKYFRAHQPVRLLYRESGHNRSTAATRERKIKGMRQSEKYLLALSDINEVASGKA